MAKHAAKAQGDIRNVGYRCEGVVFTVDSLNSFSEENIEDRHDFLHTPVVVALARLGHRGEEGMESSRALIFCQIEEGSVNVQLDRRGWCTSF